MIKSSSILLLLLVLSLSARTPFNLTNQMAQPKVSKEEIPARTVNKLIFENYVESLSRINFQMSSFLYVHEGALYGSDAYNLSNYGGFSSHCRIYRTDLKLRQYRQMVFNVKPENTLVVENKNSKIDNVLANIFIAHENKFISVYQVVTPPQFGGIDLTVQKVDFSMGSQLVLNFSVEAGENQKINLFTFGDQAYIVTNTKIQKYNCTTKDKVAIEGYTPLNSTDKELSIFKVEAMDDNVFNQKKRFYVQTSRKIYVYEFKTQLEVELVVSIDEFADVNLITSTYSNGYFYATAFNKLFVINFSDTKTYTVFEAPVNGTCDFMEKFSTTLHVSCQYQKLAYVIQFFALASTVTINRFYASEDIQGRARTRRLGFGKMAIITDDDLRIASYGINRNVLLQNQVPPAEFIFTFKYGIDIVPIKKATSPLSMVMVSFTAEKMAIMQIQQNPPQIYCEYPTDKVGSQYQILMQFNTSLCSYVRRQQDLLYGNLQNICEVSIPILVVSKQVQLEQKHTNFIQIILFLMIVGTILLIAALALKCHKNFRAQIEKAQKTIERLKKGYKDDPKKLVET